MRAPTLLLLAAGAAAVEFPALEQVPDDLRMPPDAAVAIAADGGFAVGGRPRFLVGAQITNTTRSSQAPTAGYPPELAWIYERPHDWAAAQRLGLDSFGFFTSDAWVAQCWPAFRSFHHAQAEEDYLAAWLRSARLPVYVDTTCFPWTHGSLARRAAGQPAEALNAGGFDGERNHWVPYSATHPAGIMLYRALWQAAVRQVQAQGLRPLYYELFNEPAYDDPSAFNRALFAVALARRFGAVEALNQAWGTAFADFAAAAAGDRTRCRPLAVAWGRFLEERFAELVAEGVRTVRELDPQAHCAVQTLGGGRWRELPMTNVNLQLLAPHLDVISTPTGGGIGVGGGPDALPARALAAADPDPRLVEGLLMRRFLATIAAGKPIVDGEMYALRDAGATVAGLWLQLARGGNAAYLFEWGKRAWDPEWSPAGSEAGGRRIAAKFPWYLLNPYGTPTEVLTAPLAFKRELARAGTAFLPRERGVPAPVALLLSTPTERWAAAAGTVDHHQVRTWAGALQFSHQPWTVLTEEQLAAGGAGRFRVVIAAGVRHVLPTTPDRLRAFVAAGGTLVAGGDVLGRDEDGRPVDRAGLVDLDPGSGDGEPAAIATDLAAPAGFAGVVEGRPARGLAAGPEWQVLARSGTAPAVLERVQGQGRVVWVGARLGTYPLAALLGGILARSGVAPLCALVREDGEAAVNIEVHASRLGGGSTWLLVNHNRVPVLARLRPAGSATAAADLIAGRSLPVADGAALVALPAHRAVVVACDGDQAGLPPVPAAELRAAVAAEAKALADERARARLADGVDDPPYDQAGMAALDLRPFANRHFLDGVAGDGQGGWTDQGAGNSLDGVPFGRQVWRGVPFDIIRFDENANRTCIALASPRMAGGLERVAGIPVGAKTGALHLLLASAWATPGAEAMRLVVRYADGGSLAVPVRCGIEVGDWWLDSGVNREPRFEARVAFRNAGGRGLFQWRWENPEPARAIAAVDLESAGKDPIAIVAAITREDPGPRLPLVAGALPAGWTMTAFNDARAGLVDGRLRLEPGQRGWCGLFAGGPAVALPEGLAGGRLDIHVAGLGPGGGALPLPPFKLRLHGLTATGAEVEGPWAELPPAADPGAPRRRAWLPLDGLLPPGTAAVTRLGIQMIGDVPPPAGLSIGLLRLAR